VPRLVDKEFELIEQQMKLVPIRASRFKTESDDDALIDSCEEDRLQTDVRDECDIDSADLQEEKQILVDLNED
jgi:hypothetical protein